MTRVVVHLGPSLSVAVARRVLAADYREPARCGDVLRAVLDGADVIGLIDGYFHHVPAVWHKEILYALAQGVAVLGAASMGALRAAELAPFGMVGVGRITAAFRAGCLTDDDEVAVRHGPAALGYPLLSEPMVNIRATLARAVRQQVLAPRVAARLVEVAKRTFYPDRSWERLLAHARTLGLPTGSLATWLPRGRVDAKAIDARLLLRTIARYRARPDRARPGFRLAHTEMWDALLQRVAGPGERARH